MLGQEGEKLALLVGHQDHRPVIDGAQGAHEDRHVRGVIAGGVAQDQIVLARRKGRRGPPLARDRGGDPAQIG
ncbi:hypothetical protein D3C72_2141380 [compost metagenome]